MAHFLSGRQVQNHPASDLPGQDLLAQRRQINPEALEDGADQPSMAASGVGLVRDNREPERKGRLCLCQNAHPSTKLPDSRNWA